MGQLVLSMLSKMAMGGEVQILLPEEVRFELILEETRGKDVLNLNFISYHRYVHGCIKAVHLSWALNHWGSSITEGTANYFPDFSKMSFPCAEGKYCFRKEDMSFHMKLTSHFIPVPSTAVLPVW